MKRPRNVLPSVAWVDLMDYDDLYEECPVCMMDGSDCNWCDGLGVVPHACEEEE